MEPRRVESDALIKSASALAQAQNDLTLLEDALQRNKLLWAIIAGDISETSHPIPTDIKINILRLAEIVFKRTVLLIAEPDAEKINLLININKQIAAGLNNV
jgi:flagellar protein FlaF